MLIASTSLEWLPAVSREEVAIIAIGCVLLWCGLRIWRGRSLIGRRVELFLLRLLSLGMLVGILMGPTIVDEQQGTVSRPAMMLVFDGSQSMQLGGDSSRWDAAKQFAVLSESQLDDSDADNVRRFRFGHQLKPLSSSSDSEESAASKSQNGATSRENHPANATDSRLADAFRQLLPQATAEPTAGIVLLSDGRVRATDTVEKLAEVFGKSDIPIHVVPVGKSSGTGDVAVVSMVVPSKVRKHTENELQVFLRSFGYPGQGTTVQVRRKSAADTEEGRLLANVPVTLRDGAQSVSLTFRVDDQPEDLVVSVTPLPDELTIRNNTVTTNIGINRTKVRVLYIEGDAADMSYQMSSSRTTDQSSGFGILDVFTNRNSTTASNLDLRTALQLDEDVECTMLFSQQGQSAYAAAPSDSNTTGFPKTRAELFAYDCVIFSNVAPNIVSKQQAEWLAQWVEGRGGGLIVAGSTSFQQKTWQDGPLEALLPLLLDGTTSQLSRPMKVEVTEPQHPVWQLRLEENLNSSLLSQLPELSIGLQNVQSKPSADVLATEADSREAVLVGHRAGRGRVLACTANLTGTALTDLAESWGSQPERSASKFWRNMVYWVTEGSSTGRRRLMATSDKRFYRPGDKLNISARAYDEAARQTSRYKIWAMFEPISLDDMTVYSSILWPENTVRESGEVGPRIAWGEELKLKANPDSRSFNLPLQLSESGTGRDNGFRIELTAYEGQESESAFSHGTQVDSTSLSVHILSDPFEQQNPLPNHELLNRIATLSGGSVLESPDDLATLFRDRPGIQEASHKDLTPAWDQWWLWLCLAVSLTAEWCRRRLTGLA